MAENSSIVDNVKKIFEKQTGLEALEIYEDNDKYYVVAGKDGKKFPNNLYFSLKKAATFLKQPTLNWNLIEKELIWSSEED